MRLVFSYALSTPQVLLSVVVKGKGSDNVTLPSSTIIAEYNRVNVTVAIPETKIFFQKKGTLQNELKMCMNNKKSANMRE